MATSAKSMTHELVSSMLVALSRVTTTLQVSPIKQAIGRGIEVTLTWVMLLEMMQLK